MKTLIHIILGISITVLFFDPSVYGQMIDQQESNYIDDELYFSRKFIQINGIASIHGEIRVKKELRAIEDLGVESAYYFDKEGKPTKKFKTHNLTGGKTDTTVTFFHYDVNNHLMIHRESDAYGYYSYVFENDKDGIALKRQYNREENELVGKFEFSLKKQYPIQTESYEYSVPGENDKNIKTIVKNDHGTPYKETLKEYNDLGLMVSVVDRYIVTGNRVSREYTYNDHGWIEDVTITNKHGNSKDIQKMVYSYDQIGNTTAIKKWSNDKLKTTIKFVYGERMFLDALLIKNEETGTIRIEEYWYKMTDSTASPISPDKSKNQFIDLD